MAYTVISVDHEVEIEFDATHVRKWLGKASKDEILALNIPDLQAGYTHYVGFNGGSDAATSLDVEAIQREIQFMHPSDILAKLRA